MAAGRSSPALRWGAWIAVAFVALAVRGFAATGLPDSPDGVRLIRSLDTYDIFDFSPHFPGYPVAVLLARLMPLDGGLAWSVCGALAGTVAALLAGWGVGHGTTRGLFVAAVLAFTPAFVIESVRVGTDVLFLPWLVGAIVWRESRAFTAGLLLGIALGVRPSAIAWGALLLVGPRPGRALVGAAAGVLLWLLPTFMVVGVEPYLHEGWRFTQGHFFDWGGAVSAQSGDYDGTRWGQIFAGWIGRPLTFGVTGLGVGVAAVTGLGCVALWRRAPAGSRGPATPAVVGGMAYLIWLIVAQNPDHSRHALPLWFVAVTFAAAGAWEWLRAPRSSERGMGVEFTLAATTLLVGLVGVSGWIAFEYRESTPPALVSARRLSEDPRFDPRTDRVYVGSDLAYFRWVGPDWDLHPVRSIGEARDDRLSLPTLPRRSWITAHGAGAPLSAPLIEAARWRGLAEWGSRSEIGLLEIGIEDE